MTNDLSIFLPYQKYWLKDKSQIKVWKKSRRIGATYVQAYEDVVDALTLKIRNKKVDVWFSSADITAAKEYIMYCAEWAKLLNYAVKDLGEVVIDEEHDVKALSLEFKNGARINALSSNPTQFRSKGGKIVLDEFAHHKNDSELWTAASASALVWGYPVRIMSTGNGMHCKYFEFVNKIQKGMLKWSLHTTSIFDAVKQGLADKVCDRKLTEKERQNWIAMLKENSGDDFTWLQEYCCVDVDEATTFLSFDLINSCVEDCIVSDISKLKGELYVGMDIGRRNDLTVITVLEKLGNVLYMRKRYDLPKTPFSEQKALFYTICELPNIRRGCIDETGIGMQMAEDAQKDFGKYKIEPITFTPKAKEEMAYKLLTSFQDKNIRIPDDEALKLDLHSVKKCSTETNSIRFDVERSETDGHGDRFWSLALALHAAINKNSHHAEVRSTGKRMNYEEKFKTDYTSVRAILRRGVF